MRTEMKVSRHEEKWREDILRRIKKIENSIMIITLSALLFSCFVFHTINTMSNERNSFHTPTLTRDGSSLRRIGHNEHKRDPTSSFGIKSTFYETGEIGYSALNQKLLEPILNKKRNRKRQNEMLVWKELDLQDTKTQNTSPSLHSDSKPIQINSTKPIVYNDNSTLEHHTFFSRNLKVERAPVVGSCNGTLFRLELKLDGWAYQTSWELVSERNNTIVAQQTYKKEDSWSKKEFETCIEPGPYRFTRFDEEHGNWCGESEGCFKIFINNMIVNKHSAYGRNEITYSFDSTSRCLIGTLFLLEFFHNQNKANTSYFNWLLHGKDPNDLISLEPDLENKDRAYYACLLPGVYTFHTFSPDLNGIDCANTFGCYRVFINNELFIDENRFPYQSSNTFHILRSGYAGYTQSQHCEQNPILSPINHVNNFIYNDNTARLLGIIHSLSSPYMLDNQNSPQYKAACWLLFDDDPSMRKEDELMIERYVLAVLFYATNQDSELLVSLDTCDYDRIICNSEKHIISIEWYVYDIQGMIPSEISHLRYLEYFDINNNQIVGKIPSEIKRLQNLKWLYLGNNNLTGTIPTEIGHLHNLKELWIESNELNGSIPSEIGLCESLEVLRLEQNRLQGSMPLDLFGCQRLRVLRLYNNSLTGTIPPEIGQLQNLGFLFLDVNNLSGSIPSEIGSLAELWLIYLGLNRLTGLLPAEIGNLNALSILSIHNNMLTGTLPGTLRNVSNLFFLDLSSNRFSGLIPNSLWNLDYNDINGNGALILNDNDLHGSVANDFCNEFKPVIGKLRIFEVDSSPWFADEQKVKCECCEANCFLWDDAKITVGGTVRPKCPSSNIHRLEFKLFYGVLDRVTNNLLDDIADFGDFANFGSLTSGFHSDICLSPSGCYLIMHDDGQFTTEFSSYNLVYSSSSLSLVNKTDCDTVELCGNLIRRRHPKRKGLNHLTQLAVPDLTILHDPSLPAYKALCWIITQDTLFNEFEICDGTLLQRYVLVFFYYSQRLTVDYENLATMHTCDWPGITCDFTNRFVKQLILPNRNLTGTLVTEIGLLTRLETLILSNNLLHGALDESIFQHMPELEIFDVGGNELEGEIPNDLLMLPNLRAVNFSNNLFVGKLPTKITYSRNLESFDLGNNLLQGIIADELLKCENLRVMDLSRNRLNGVIPPTMGELKNLRVLKVNENKLSGSIPLGMFNASQIEVLMLRSNAFTGSIPTQVGILANSRIISMSHNLFKGTIPTELQNLKMIEYIHLHQNQLTGTAPKLEFAQIRPNTFITDCGDPSFSLPSPLICSSCTMCCNSEKKCQQNKVQKTPIWATAFLVGFMVPVAVGTLKYLILRTRAKNVNFSLFENRDPLSIYSKDSVYCFVLCNNMVAWIAYVATATIQMLLFFVYLQASNIRNEDSDWQFSVLCPGNSIQCDDENTVGTNGWILFLAVTILYLGSDIILSMLQIQKAIALLDLQLFLSGFLQFFLTSWALFTSGFYNLALAEKNTDLIMNAVILLFINDLDEQFLKLLQSIAPNWTNERLNEIELNIVSKFRDTSIPMNIGQEDHTMIIPGPSTFLPPSSAASAASFVSLQGLAEQWEDF